MQGRCSAVLSGALAILLIATALAGGCSSGSPTVPEEVAASWEFLTYVDAGLTLRVEGDGSLSLEGDGGPDAPDLGLLAPATWSTVRAAAERAEFDLISGSPTLRTTGVGIVRLREAGRLWGFSWVDEYQLTEAQRDLVGLLQGIRGDVRSEEDPLVAQLPVETILHGLNALFVEPREALVRDNEALVDLIDEALPGAGAITRPIDFANEMVVAVFLGAQRPRSDLELSGDASWTLAGDLRIPIRVAQTEGPCPKSTSPYIVLCLPRSESEIFFLREVTTPSCEEG